MKILKAHLSFSTVLNWLIILCSVLAIISYANGGQTPMSLFIWPSLVILGRIESLVRDKAVRILHQTIEVLREHRDMLRERLGMTP